MDTLCPAPDESGRLNALQRVMYRWSALHPYNATHTYKIAGPLRLKSLREAIAQTYQAHGLGWVTISDDGRSFRYETDAAPPVTVLTGDGAPDDRLTVHLTRELNRPFRRPRSRPLRFSVIDAGPGFHYVTAAYDHWIADSTAARLVLRSVLGRYCGLAIPENDEPLDLYPGTYRDVFAHRLSRLGLAWATVRSVSHWLRHATPLQPAYSCKAQMAVNHQLYHLLPGTVERLRQAARSLGATVHDLLLAALARAMARHLPRRSSRQGRPLALGTIVDARNDANTDLSQSLGAFLAYFVVRCQVEKDTTLGDLTRQIEAVTRPIKAGRRYFDSVANMQFVNTVGPWIRAKTKPHFLRKVQPMTGGISNVVVRDPWMEENRDCILDYSRAAPTGPMLPLALTPTSLGDRMNIGVTYRITAFTQAKIDSIMELLLDQIEHPDGLEPLPEPCRESFGVGT